MSLFVTFEGGEAAGKTTQIALLAERLTSCGHSSLVTREPGGTPLGEELRNLLKFHEAGKNMFPEAELLLFAASRAQHAREIITPALQSGKTVLCDRYYDSTTAYQGAARRLDPEQVAWINSFAVGACRPDVTIYLDLAPEKARERMALRNQGFTAQTDRMETEPLDFYRKIRECYLQIAQEQPTRFHVIDGDHPVGKIENEIWQIIAARL